MRMMIDEEKRIELGNYIKNIMLEKSVGFNQLSLKSKINIKPLNEILYGRQQKINPFYLQKIALALRIDYRDLYRIVGYLDEEACDKSLESNVKRIITAANAKTIEIPVYGRASAGNGYINLGEVIRTTTIAILNDERIPEDIFSVEVHGDSMYPTFLEGDLVVVDPICDLFINNRVYVVSYNDETFIKRVVDHGKYIQLISDNPDKVRYSDIIISKDEEGASFKCNGKVIRLERKF